MKAGKKYYLVLKLSLIVIKFPLNLAFQPSFFTNSPLFNPFLIDFYFFTSKALFLILKIEVISFVKSKFCQRSSPVQVIKMNASIILNSIVLKETQ